MIQSLYIVLNLTLWFTILLNEIDIFNIFGINFSIGHVHNLGAAWGVLQNYHDVLFVFRCIFVIVFSTYIFFFNKKQSYNVPFCLIITGAVGNILDFIIYGFVVDMFHFNFWGYDYPLFNVADSSIFVGVVWLICITLRKRD